jgi:hypothetical protein
VFGVVAVRLLVGGACRRRNEELPQQTRGNIPGTTNEFDMNFQGVASITPVRPVQPRQLRRDAMPREGHVTAQGRSLPDVGAGGAPTGGGT